MMRLIGVIGILVVVAPAQVTGLRPAERAVESPEAFPCTGPLDADGDPIFSAVKIVDAETGRPIPGATVRLPFHPDGWILPEEIRDLHVAVSDERGWLRAPVRLIRQSADYQIADAPGYAAEEHVEWDDIQPLVRGTDVPVRVLDYLGRPVAGAVVALNLGCTHIAHQRTATTDSRGVALLREIRPERLDDFHVLHPRLHAGAGRLSREWRPGDPPVDLHVAPGVVVEGRAVREDGSPWVGAVIGDPSSYRRWCRTDAEGRFRLMGVAAGAPLRVREGGEQGEVVAEAFAPPPGRPLLVRRGGPGEQAPVNVRLLGAGGSAESVTLIALREDGFARYEAMPSDGEHRFALPVGRYEILVDGGLGPWADARAELEVRRGEVARFEHALLPKPTVRIEPSDRESFDLRAWRIALTSERGFREVEEQELLGGLLPIPADRACRLRLSQRTAHGLVVRYCDLPDPADPERPLVTLEAEPAATVRARAKAPDGTPRRASLHLARRFENWRWADAEAPEDRDWGRWTPFVRTWQTGTFEWELDPGDPALLPARGTLTIREPGASIDLGEVSCPRRDARPVPHVEWPSRLSPMPGTIEVGPWHATGFLQDALEVSITDLQAISEARWRPQGAMMVQLWERGSQLLYPVRHPGPASAEEPLVLRFPDTSLRIAVRSPSGTPLAGASVFVDGHELEAGEEAPGRFEVVGLPLGEREVIVVRAGYISQVIDLKVHEDDARELLVTLRPRP